MAEALFSIRITQAEEEKYFIGNKVFYKIIYGYLNKMSHKTPTYNQKKLLIPFIQGKTKPLLLIFHLGRRLYPKYFKEVVETNPEPYKRALGFIPDS